MKNALSLDAVTSSLELINQILTPRSVETRARARETNAPDTMNQADVDKQINQVRAADDDDDDENAKRRDVRLFANPLRFSSFAKQNDREEKPERRLT